MRVAIFNENCMSAGRAVGDDEVAQYIEEHGRPCDDWVLHESTPEGLLSLADEIEANARPGGGGMYDRRHAESIRDAVYDERPDLRPIRDD